MNWKITLLTTVAAAALGFSMTACELSEECDPATDPGCEVADTGGDTGGDVDTGPTLQSYNYILIEDEDDNASGDRPGADIDGIELNKNGVSFFLSQIHESGFGADQPDGANRNFNNALGQPQGQCVGEAPADWDLTTIVSLGGVGGYLIGSFDGLADIETGDALTIYACTGPASEDWTASVGVATTLSDPDWFTVVTAGRATVTINIPNLPAIPAN